MVPTSPHLSTPHLPPHQPLVIPPPSPYCPLTPLCRITYISSSVHVMKLGSSRIPLKHQPTLTLTRIKGIWLVEWVSCRDLQSVLKHNLMAATTGEGSSKNTFNQIIKRNGQFAPKKFLIKFNPGAFFFVLFISIQSQQFVLSRKLSLSHSVDSEKRLILPQMYWYVSASQARGSWGAPQWEIWDVRAQQERGSYVQTTQI